MEIKNHIFRQKTEAHYQKVGLIRKGAFRLPSLLLLCFVKSETIFSKKKSGIMLLTGRILLPMSTYQKEGGFAAPFLQFKLNLNYEKI